MFNDRIHAGTELSSALTSYSSAPDAVILGIPRGGTVVADVVARNLDLPLDVVVTRKIGAPGNPELAIGAVDASGHLVLDQEWASRLGVSADYIGLESAHEVAEAKRREELFRVDREPLDLADKVAIIVDDGLATGSTAQAAVQSVRCHGVTRVVLGVPVASKSSVRKLSRLVDELVCLSTPRGFQAVGQFYRDFEQTADSEVVEIMRRNDERYRGAHPAAGHGAA